MSDILKNPTLGGFKTVTHFTDNTGNVGSIEYPDHWEFVYTPRHADDPNRIPQSLHRDKGFVISAGYRQWEAGYLQRGVQLRKGQRYLAKAVFMPDVNFPPGAQPDLTAIQWQFWLEGGGDKIGSGWRSTGRGEYKREEETLFVVEAASDVAIDYAFKVKSDYAGNACDFNIYQLSLEEVPADYGGADVPRIGTGAAASAVAPGVRIVEGASTRTVENVTATVTPLIPREHSPSPDITMGTAVIQEERPTLADVLTPEDLAVILKGLREMKNITPNPAVVAAFERLAEVLERLKR